MKKNVAFDLNSISLYYSRNKMYIVPLLVIAVCILLGIEVIAPQFESWYATQQVIAANRLAITALNTNIDVLSGFDDTTLDTNLTLATTALPGGKDLLGTLGAINRAATISKVALSDYSFQSDKVTKVLSVDLVVTGNLSIVQQFITSMKNELPLATVDAIDYVSRGGSTIRVSFYYSAYPHFTFSSQTTVAGLNAKQRDTLSQLSSFDSSINQPITLPIATTAAVLASPTPPSSPNPSVTTVPVATSSATASKSAK